MKISCINLQNYIYFTSSAITRFPILIFASASSANFLSFLLLSISGFIALSSKSTVESSGLPFAFSASRGAIITIDVREIQRSKDFFSDLIAFIESDSFPLKKEYNRARKYTEMLNNKVNAKHDTDDWFDDF